MDAAFLLQCFVTLNLLASPIAQAGSGLENDYGDVSDDDDDSGASFSEIWPLLIALVAGVGFIVVLIIACRGSCRFRKRRPRSGQDSTGSYRRTNVTGHTDPSPSDHDPAGVWSVQMDTIPAVTSPTSPQLKPPPYCKDPPSYDDVTKGVFPAEGGGDKDVCVSENSGSTGDLRVVPPKSSSTPSLFDVGEPHRRETQSSTSSHVTGHSRLQ